MWEAETEAVSLAPTASAPVTFAEYTPSQEVPSEATAVVLHLVCGRVEIQQGAGRAVIENTIQAIKALC